MPVLSLGNLRPVAFTLRDLDGYAEQALDPDQPALSAFRLAQHLVVLPEDTALGSLPVALVHRLLWAIYRSLYAGPVENQARCSDCAEAFEFALDLDTILAAQDAEAATVPAPDDGWWTLPAGGLIRAPCQSDLGTGSSGALLSRLVDGPVDENVADAFLDRAAPLLDFDVDTACPHCDAQQRLRFSMPQYLALKLHGEQPFLYREIHLIASQYHWSQAEILSLSRSRRRAYSALIQSERLSTQSRRLQAVS